MGLPLWDSLIDSEENYLRTKIPFETWIGKDKKGNPVTKKILPVKEGTESYYWWLNVKNPMYKQLITLGLTGQTKFKIMQTGNQDNTKYILCK